MYTILWIRWNVPSLLQSYHQNVELKTIYQSPLPKAHHVLQAAKDVKPPKSTIAGVGAMHFRVWKRGVVPSKRPQLPPKRLQWFWSWKNAQFVFLNLKVMSNTFLLLLVCNLPAQRRAGSWTLEVFLSPPKPLIFPGNMTKSFLWFPDDLILGIPSNCGRIFMRKWW